VSLPPEALAIAERRAAEDRDLLARLRSTGAVLRRPGSRQTELVRDVEARAFPPRVANLAIRPKAKKRRR
jgi:hypothetical protein